MSRNELQVVVGTLGNIIGVEPTEVIETLKEWNKSKQHYPVNIVSVIFNNNGTVNTNSKEYGEIIDMLVSHAKDVSKNTLDADVVREEMIAYKIISDVLVGMRKQVTGRFKDIISEFTAPELNIQIGYNEMKVKLDKINEKEYKNRERAIREHFESRLKDDALAEVVSMDAFKDFIEAKRKTNIFTSTGKLTKSIRDAITEAIRVVAEPLIEAKKIEERKALQSKQFDRYIVNFVVDDNTPALEAHINQLIKFKESVSDLYPDIQDHCMRSINNKIALMEGNIRANKAIEEKEAVQNADGELLEVYNEIKEKSNDMTLTGNELVDMSNRLREIYPKLQFAENQENVKKLGASISARVAELDAKNVAKEVTQQEDSEESIYLVSINDIEVLANMQIKANSEEEAKKELVKRFEAHLSMIRLYKKGE